MKSESEVEKTVMADCGKI